MLVAIAPLPNQKENVMKHFYLLLGLFIGVLFLSPTESNAQWQRACPVHS
jgi:hypothetical protein